MSLSRAIEVRIFVLFTVVFVVSLKGMELHAFSRKHAFCFQSYRSRDALEEGMTKSLFGTEKWPSSCSLSTYRSDVPFLSWPSEVWRMPPCNYSSRVISVRSITLYITFIPIVVEERVNDPSVNLVSVVQINCSHTCFQQQTELQQHCQPCRFVIMQRTHSSYDSRRAETRLNV